MCWNLIFFFNSKIELKLPDELNLNSNVSPLFFLSIYLSMIERSPFETNSFLIIEKEKSLIEYAARSGSIQTFKYLL